MRIGIRMDFREVKNMTEILISLVKKDVEKGPVKLKDGYEIYAIYENGKEISPFVPLPKVLADRLRLKLASEDNVQNIIKVAFENAEPLSIEFEIPNFSLIRKVQGVLTGMLKKIDKKIEDRIDELSNITIICADCKVTELIPPLDYDPKDNFEFICSACVKKSSSVKK